MENPPKGLIAQQGTAAYMYSMGDGTAYVLSFEAHRLYGPTLIGSLAARGYWEPLEGSEQSVLQRWRREMGADSLNVLLPKESAGKALPYVVARYPSGDDK